MVPFFIFIGLAQAGQVYIIDVYRHIALELEILYDIF